MAVYEHEIDPETGEILGDAPKIRTAPEDRGEQEADADEAFEAMVRERVEAEMAAERAKTVTGKTAAEIEAEQVAAALAKANAAAAHEAKIAAKVAEKIAESKARQEAMAREAEAKPNGAAPVEQVADTPAPPPAGKPAGRQVGKTKVTEVAVDAGLAAMFEADAGKGLDFRADDLAIPRLYMLQDMSPQVKERSADYVSGARPGMWFNTVTGQIAPSVTIITIKHQRRYVAWRPRLDNGGGGGLVKPDVPREEYLSYEETGISVRSYRDEKGLVEVVDTPELVALLLPENGSGISPMPVAISFPKTKAKVLARMMTIATMQVGHHADGTEFPMALYSNVFRLSSKIEGEGAQSYFVPVEEYLGRVTRTDIYARAKRLYEQFAGAPVHVADVGSSEQV